MYVIVLSSTFAINTSKSEYVNRLDVVLFLFYFQGFPGNNSGSEFQASGAYIFRPLTPDTQPVSTNCTM
jgi:hypothetical protein